MPELTTFEKVREIAIERIVNISSIEEVTKDAKILDLCVYDDLDRIELIIACEDEWKIKISDDEVESTITIGQLVALIDQKIAAKTR